MIQDSMRRPYPAITSGKYLKNGIIGEIVPGHTGLRFGIGGVPF